MALASVSFDQMDARYDNVEDAQRTTCEWVLRNPAYVAWNERDNPPRHRILWIAGKPGAGKSTLMKFALAQAKNSVLEDEIVLSFFFDARGDDLEKTTLGVYRVLLYQLLNKAPDLQSVLDNFDASDLSQAKSPTWSLDMLQEFLSAAMQGLGQRRVKCFIDALDECNEEQVRDMVEYLENLGEHILSDDSRLHICFASRHYPTIEIHNNWRLVLEDEAGHAEDLKKYIRHRLRAGEGKLVGEIRDQTQRKANGVFMWTVLVVHILNDEFRRGRIFAVKKRLQEVPTKLSDLFKDLLRRDRVNMRDLLLCLQWILFAKRLLSREEFYSAMVAGLSHDFDHVDGWKPDPLDPEEVTTEDMNRFVLNSSKGLAELTKSEKAPTVQFIHESVRDFLIIDGGLRELWPELGNELASSSHERLKKCCSRYMTADLSTYQDPGGALPEASSEDAKTLREQVCTKFPFLDYATKEGFYHANEAAHTIGQKTFLAAFAVEQWIHVNNVLELAHSCRHSPHHFTAMTYAFD
ncbi:hypothetical protein LTR09_011955 [Extremus antarcticus]|uniref:NACHT domain-containing protein n=1 Tax=Extremus antarcticus TaxID=702011 RepID=A0AAJ0G4Q2_9PEZI|nr:hypothetical protein LTR09_011955 [Extremus antarcticus]